MGRGVRTISLRFQASGSAERQREIKKAPILKIGANLCVWGDLNPHALAGTGT